MRGPRRFTEAEKHEIWDRIAAGHSVAAIAAALGRYPSAVRAVQQTTGGVRPRSLRRSDRSLSLSEREEISRGLAAREPCRGIALRLGRAPSTVCREVARNGGGARYRACAAERRMKRLIRRPKAAKLTQCPRLQEIVEAKLALKWSPQQISRWLPGAYPFDLEMRVSHETIYLALYVQGRGALRQELHRALRTGRALRRPKKSLPKGQGKIPDMVLISERPADVEDRAVPGHWEGDLIMGSRKTCIGTLVERSTRYVMLLKLQKNTAEEVRSAMSTKILALPTELRRSVTWDRGTEMSQHLRFTIDTGVQVYFCDPNSPWQRGTNENTNGLLRQYFPKGTDLSVHSQDQLDSVASELNERPRQTLAWMTPSQRLAEVIATTA
jgi:transposase, IS30 family